MFDETIIEAIKNHSMAEYPKEACGAVLDDGYHPLLNHSPTPTEAFECTAQIAPLLAAERLRALVHSHPDGPENPTAYDMRQQEVMDVPWGICPCSATGTTRVYFWHSDFEPPPLIGREFRFGPSGTDGRGDCAALVRDYFRLERGVRLKEFPRENLWWTRPDVSYRDNLLATGFVPISPQALVVGDVFLAQIRAERENHCGIFTGHGRILHHLANRISKEDSLTSWLRLITSWYRHVPAN